MSRQPKVYRICAVCGKRHGSTFGFKTVLTRIGLEGDKAVPACVAKAAREYDERLKAVKP